MKKGILGKKIGMTQIFADNADVIPVTVIEAGPCVVLQTKTTEKDGYEAVKVGFEDKKLKTKNEDDKESYNIPRPIKGQFDKVKLPYKKHLMELKFEDSDQYKVGDEIKVEIFKEGDKVDITGISKGKGFTGVIKRWNQGRGPTTHGSRYHRGPGSMGASSSPAKVFKNKRLSGHMGNERVTVQNLEVAKVYADKNLLLVKGGIPGPKGSLVVIKESVKRS
ncbi:MAG: 50S ribosomal protein L3 [Clostridia bacterium]|nr:50S ribosomal protein L3 [Clostridia bacterium]